jgi:hypothetical protein
VAAHGARGRKPDSTNKPDSLQPWQFFVLAALGCATAALFASRGQGVSVVVLLTVLMGAAGLTGVAALRMLKPLVSPDDDRTLMIGQRTRAALEREKALSLRAIKELEFDRAMGKVSDVDFVEMSSRLRARATRLMRQLDAGAGYRERIERDLEQRIGKRIEDAEGAEAAEGTRGSCASCATRNDADAKFCKSCGQKL